MICIAHRTLVGSSNTEYEMRGMWHVRERGEVRTGVWWRNIRTPLGRPCCRWVNNIKMYFKSVVKAWIDLAQDRGKCRPLWTR
jgi:hypothetical protein